jgi:hypothetical protein
MLIVNDEQRLLAGILSLEERCKYCSKAFAEYPLIQSDDVDQTVYHAACAIVPEPADRCTEALGEIELPLWVTCLKRFYQ